MKASNYLILVLLFFAQLSCTKKEYPKSVTEGAPVFGCNMTVNGSPINIEAGINNYYMYSSFQQDSNNVYNFIGGLKQTNCSNCTNALQIQINDFSVVQPNTSVNIDSAIMAKSYDYLGSNAASFYTAQFQSIYNKSAASYLWNFGDGSISNTPNPSHVYKKSGKYNVSLTINGSNSCVSSINSFQNIGTFNNKFRTSIQDSTLSGNGVSLSATLDQGVAPYSYSWNFGDGTSTSVLPAPTHNYQYTGSYPVSLRVIDANNDTAYAKYNVVTQSDLSSCAANYKITNVSQTQNTLALSNVLITWTDSNGIAYTSKNNLQPSTSFFKIVSVENYSNNESNQLTKKIHLKFKCTLYNGSNFILIDNADAIISISYK